MADNGPPERPPFNDPKDPRWYSDPNRTSSGYPGAPSGAGGAPRNGKPAGQQDGWPAGPPASMPPYGASSRPASPYETPPPGVRHSGYGFSEPKGLSIAALVCAVVAVFTGGFLVIPQILAVVFGHMALKREPSGKVLALTGLVIGYVMVLLTVLVVALFIPFLAFAFTGVP